MTAGRSPVAGIARPAARKALAPAQAPALNPPRPIAVLAIACASLLAACADGYPTEDLPQIDPALMTQPQLVAALNALGKEPHLGKRWRYALRDGCELEVSAGGGAAPVHRVALEGAGVATRSADGVSEVRLVPQAGGETQAVTVLETRKWSDTVTARTLLTQLETRCRGPAPLA